MMSSVPTLDNKAGECGSSGTVLKSADTSSSLINRRYSRFRLWELFSSSAFTNNNSVPGVSADLIRRLLNSIGLYPSASQVRDMVHCSCQLAGRQPADHVTFGEFCVFVTYLQELYRRQSHSPSAAKPPRSQLKAKAIRELHRRRLKRRLSGRGDSFQVFLGGSCNPTTWRQESAIPFLKRHGITYYNPQVQTWIPELMEREDIAKQAAEILFFVVDSQQARSISSIVEVAYLAGCGRQLVLILKAIEQPVVIADETLSPSEVIDIKRSHAFLTDQVERMSIPVFTDVSTALDCTRKMLHNRVAVTDLKLDDGVQPVKHPHLRVTNELIRIKEIFSSIDANSSSELSIDDVELAYKAVTGHSLSRDLLLSRVRSTGGKVSFDDFCCIVSEFRYTHHATGVMRKFSGGLCGCRRPRTVSCWRRSRAAEDYDNQPSEFGPRDVFLGGSCSHTDWRENIAIPLLLKHAISYYNPHIKEGWNEYRISQEAEMKEVCRLLLFVITDDTRGITSMLEAAHFIGRGCNVVVCVQKIKEGTKIGGEVISAGGLKDYNRAREYLKDIANRDGVPVFEDIKEAVECVVQRLRNTS